jgi:eukaryotic-like serine/threonine-protein kinase
MIGKTLGHYRILENLGSGGMGVVYKAKDTHLGRLVAIKVLSPKRVADPEAKQRFVKEAKAASALNHPNIVTIYEIASEDDCEFIAMEYVRGKTLGQLAGKRRLPCDRVLGYAVQMADALAAAHAIGVIHRDFKPANIMVVEGQGLIKVLDFGLAKLSGTNDGKNLTSTQPTRSILEPETAEGQILGTLAYMSPEQAEGKPVDARSDIFSFGSVLYEMLAGRRAFQGDSKISILAAVLREEPRPLCEIDCGVPRELEELIGLCLRKDREQRIQHMDDLKLLLEHLKQRPETGRLGAKRAGLQNTQQVSMFIVLAVLVALVAVGVWKLTRSNPSTGPATLTRLTWDSGLTENPVLSPDGRLLAYASDRSGEGNLDIWVQQLSGGEPVRLTNHPSDESTPSFSPDSSRIAFRSDRDNGGIYIISALGGQERLIARSGNDPRFSPDGAWIVYWVVNPPIFFHRAKFTLWLLPAKNQLNSSVVLRTRAIPSGLLTGSTSCFRVSIFQGKNLIGGLHLWGRMAPLANKPLGPVRSSYFSARACWFTWGRGASGVTGFSFLPMQGIQEVFIKFRSRRRHGR